jgi:hypothetical protein
MVEKVERGKAKLDLAAPQAKILNAAKALFTNIGPLA